MPLLKNGSRKCSQPFIQLPADLAILQYSHSFSLPLNTVVLCNRLGDRKLFFSYLDDHPSPTKGDSKPSATPSSRAYRSREQRKRRTKKKNRREENEERRSRGRGIRMNNSSGLPNIYAPKNEGSGVGKREAAAPTRAIHIAKSISS
ncbi:hypothetical protein RJT34_02427 [Clitoria ternatea]|uniref:Uncharacterized protein n=1 Tax=Clitoria ternatea TaxID=43366 RepID=A0AAN9Q1P4_CLITE